MWDGPPDEELNDPARPARIAQLEQQLGIEPGTEVELTRLAERIDALWARRDELRSEVGTTAPAELARKLAELDHEIRQTAQQVNEVTRRLIAARQQ